MCVRLGTNRTRVKRPERNRLERTRPGRKDREKKSPSIFKNTRRRRWELVSSTEYYANQVRYFWNSEVASSAEAAANAIMCACTNGTNKWKR